jgi:hypothetical protein
MNYIEMPQKENSQYLRIAMLPGAVGKTKMPREKSMACLESYQASSTLTTVTAGGSNSRPASLVDSPEILYRTRQEEN